MFVFMVYVWVLGLLMSYMYDCKSGCYYMYSGFLRMYLKVELIIKDLV